MKDRPRGYINNWRSHEATQRRGLSLVFCLIGLYAVLALSGVGAVIYVLVHFAAKFW